jgi:hypothetical protein
MLARGADRPARFPVQGHQRHIHAHVGSLEASPPGILWCANGRGLFLLKHQKKRVQQASLSGTCADRLYDLYLTSFSTIIISFALTSDAR